MDGGLSRESIAERIAELAFARPDDAVALALRQPPGEGEGDVDTTGLDLRLVTDIKRGRDGALELKLLDRAALITLLVELTGAGERESERAGEFFEALDTAAKSIGGDEK